MSRNKVVKRRSFGNSFRRLNLSVSSRSLSSSFKSSDPPSNVKVVVRVRPENDYERLGQHRCVVHVPDETLLVFDPDEEQQDFFFQGRKQQQRDLLKRVCKNKSFCFDRVFDGESSNRDVFEECAIPVIDGLMNGFNCSVFAYGATGAGKTHTMLGNSENPGITFLIVMELFDRIAQLENKSCDLSVSYLEVYNEAIKDLICPSKDLQIREDVNGARIAGLSIHKPKDARCLLDLLEYGNKNRTQHPTDANKESSRSHAVFQVYIKLTDNVPGVSESVKFAKMSLVDLAGSERANVIQSRDKFRMREGANINQSLLALGSCINALADRKKANHIPYRNSKLTRILKDSLGGNCQTVMIAAVSPSSITYDDTYNTLNYANRAKQIKIQLRRNAVNVDVHISKHKKIMEALQKENATLKVKLKMYEDAPNKTSNETSSQTSAIFINSSVVPVIHVSPPLAKRSWSEQVCNETMNHSNSTLDAGFVSKMDDLFAEKLKTHLKAVASESNAILLKENNQWKESLHRQSNCMIINKEKLARSTSKMSSMMEGSQMKKNYYAGKKRRCLDQLAEVEELIRKALSEYCAVNSEQCQQYLKRKQLELEKAVLLQLTEHMYRFAVRQKRGCDSGMRFSEDVLKQLRNHQLLLRGYELLTPDLERDVAGILAQLEGRKEVNWADEIKPMMDDYTDLLFLPSAEFALRSRKSLSLCTSTPGPSKKSKDLADFLSPDDIGNHSYIQVASVPASPVSSDDDCLKATPNVVPPRGKLGSPHPAKTGLHCFSPRRLEKDPLAHDPVRKSLQETFSNNDMLDARPISPLRFQRGETLSSLMASLKNTFSPATVTTTDLPCQNLTYVDDGVCRSFTQASGSSSKSTSESSNLNVTMTVKPQQIRPFGFGARGPTSNSTLSKLRRISKSTTTLINPVAPFQQPDTFRSKLFGKVTTNKTPLKEKVTPPTITKPNAGKKWLKPGPLRSTLTKPSAKENLSSMTNRTQHKMGSMHKSQSTSNLTTVTKPKF